MKNIIGIAAVFIVFVVAALGLLFIAQSRNSGSQGSQLSVSDQSPDAITEEIADHEDDIQNFEISPGEVVEKIKNNEDIILLDVRTPEEYTEIHLENVLLLPVEELSKESLANIGLGEEMKNKEIIIYCRSGARSKIAYNIMNSLGYTNIKSIAGGMIHWEEDEYPYTEKGEYIKKTTTSDNSTSNAPKIVLSSTFHDFGKVPQYGGTVQADFEIQNEGTQLLTIGEIMTSCSCTSAEISQKDILPGKKADMTVTFDPDFHEEPFDTFKRTVFIPSNDPALSEAEVEIQVDILEGE